MILMGKHRPTYTPHVDNGDYVVVINAEKVVFTGKKWEQKEYAWYTGYPRPAQRDGRQAAASAAGVDPPRGRPPHVAEEQAGLQDA